MSVATETLPALPSTGALLVRAALTARGRGGDTVPAVSVRVADVAVDRHRLAAYQRLTGFPVSDTLPHPYPWVLALPVQTALMVRPDFPLALPGLVHLSSRATGTRAVDAAEPLTLEVTAGDLRPHRRGRTVTTRVEASAGGETVWTCENVYLSRGPGEDAAPRDAVPDAPTGPPAARWRLPADLGRRYAAVSGDVNPIHLHPLTARPLGFPRPIAHGTWTWARTVAALGRVAAGAVTTHVRFTRPVPLPSTVELVRAGGDGLVTAALRSSRDPGGTHLVLTAER
ncbi:MaoC family dehydratase [Phycicoccus flavus]|uniref:MaoC family dehydratase n=1 Tax=Phycicoccus flavus TaxID=2502783 RepID=UPI000FEC1522|nr:MaoC/PaaZ C-terminal domain-containing protein [Phycicoccus flavus]NHA67642.1 hypothetical protein [Phycicoccus flavus]